MKKKILTLAAIAICASVAATGTLAYFTASDEAHNVITSGGVDIKVVETMEDAEGNITVFPETPISGVMPGGDVSKIVQVENVGPSDAWIRVEVDSFIPLDPMNGPANQDSMDTSIISYLRDDEEISGLYDADAYMENIAGWDKGWVQVGPYFYYTEPVPAGEKTEIPLFDEVHFAKEMGNEYQNCRVEINVMAEAIQVDNNELAEGDVITSVWPDYWTAFADENN